MQNTTKDIAALIENTLKDKNEFGALLKRFTPLINKYVGSLYKDEPEEIRAEMVLALWEAVTKIKYYDNDGKCLAYLALAAFAKCSRKRGTWLIARGNKFLELYRKSKIKHDFYISGIPEETFEQEDFKNRFDEMIFKEDIKKLLSDYSEKKRQIFNDIIFEDKSDTYIAKKYGLTRQYVNRLRKNFFEELKEKYVQGL